MKVVVHERVCRKHRELTEQDVLAAWFNSTNLTLCMDSPNFPEYVCIGFDSRGRSIEMVAVISEDGILIYHAMTPPTKATLREIRRSQRRLR